MGNQTTAPKDVCLWSAALSRDKAWSLWIEYPTLADPSVTAWWPILSITTFRGAHS